MVIKNVLLFSICIFYSVISVLLSGQNQEWEKSFLSVSTYLAIGINCLIILKVLHVAKHSETFVPLFWKLIGLFFLTFSGYMVIQGIPDLMKDPYYVLLHISIELVSYLILSTALLYKIRKRNISFKGNPYVFDLFIYTVVIIAVVNRFFVSAPLNGEAFTIWSDLLYGFVHVLMISVVVCILVIYYFNQIEVNNRNITQILAGLMILVSMDFFGNRSADIRMDLIEKNGWILALLVIYFAVQNQWNGVHLVANTLNRRKKVVFWTIRELIFPFIAILSLIFLTLKSFHWEINQLAIACLVTVPIYIAKQFKISRDNNRLLEEMEGIAFRDPVTQLLNRDYFLKTMPYQHTLTTESQTALLIIDIDRLKTINEVYGHSVGDRVIFESAKHLKAVIGVRTEDHLFAMGGGEFALLYPVSEMEELRTALFHMCQVFDKEILVGNRQIVVSISIGAHIISNRGEDENIFEKCGIALSHAKETTGSSFTIFDKELQTHLIRKSELEKELQHAIERNELFIHYQPKFCLRTQKIVGVEALLRWKNVRLGSVSPAEFIPIAESMGLIYDIGEWVLREAVKQSVKWNENGNRSIPVSINVSVIQLEDGRFLEMVQDVLQKSGIHPSWIELEITESVAQNMQENILILSELKRMGVACSIDDFGTGYSSLNALERLPIDTLKIDKSFVDRINNSVSESIIKTIIHLCHVLNLDIVAEGVETQDQADKLRNIGCRVGQGYYFSRPLAVNDLDQLIESQSA